MMEYIYLILVSQPNNETSDILIDMVIVYLKDYLDESLVSRDYCFII